MTTPDGFEAQIIDSSVAETIINFLTHSVKGPREAMGVIGLVIKKLNTEPFRDGPLPSNAELAAEMLVMLNSIKRVGLQ